MKIQKGKLSTSNAVVIGVLLVLLYLVMPTNSRKKSSAISAAESAEIATPQAPPTVIEPVPVTHPEESTSISGKIATASNDASQESLIRPVPEINEHQLQVLVTENPFLTRAAMNALDSKSQDASASITENTESSSTASAPVEQQPARISLIYTSSRGTEAAILNDEIVYPGSRTSGNARVLSVHPDGIALQSSRVPSVDSM